MHIRPDINHFPEHQLLKILFTSPDCDFQWFFRATTQQRSEPVKTAPWIACKQRHDCCGTFLRM